MDKKRCYIAGAGDFYGDILPEKHDFIIAADGGCAELVSRGITMDLIVGDFDSLPAVPDRVPAVCHPAEKNDTDMMLAVCEAFTRGYRTFIINGGLGGRLDHTIANIQVITYIAQNGACGCLVGRDICITAVTNGEVRFFSGASGYISVFCAGERAEGVTLEGLKYPLNNAVLTCDFPLGVSNEFTGEHAAVRVRNGTLIVTWAGGFRYLIF